MNYATEAAEKEKAARQTKSAYDNTAKPSPSDFGSAQAGIGSIGGYAVNSLDQPCRASLRDRVWSQLHRAESESRKLARLHELNELLDRNPEVARILDLIEEVRG